MNDMPLLFPPKPLMEHAIFTGITLHSYLVVYIKMPILSPFTLLQFKFKYDKNAILVSSSSSPFSLAAASSRLAAASSFPITGPASRSGNPCLPDHSLQRLSNRYVLTSDSVVLCPWGTFIGPLVLSLQI